MREITMISIQEKKKNRCNIFVDNEFYCSLDVELVIKYGLKKGIEFNEQQFALIKCEDDKRFALSLATKYVSRAIKTKKQVITYLKGKGFDDKTVYSVIDMMKEYGFINDEEYARRYLETYSNTQGKRLIDYKLMMKGIKKEDIESAHGDVFVDNKENARCLAEKKLKNKEKTFENITKTYRYLISKGFSYEEAEYAVSIFKEQL